MRDSRRADLPDVQQIYAFYVLSSVATFEEEPPSVEDLLARRNKIIDAGLPYLIATLDGAVAGYAYASSYRPRVAYRYTIEDSVYVRQDLRSRGIGRALLAVLLDRCQVGCWRQMVAVIGDSANSGSIALHSSCGFEHVGTLKGVGYKFGKWVDTVLMQRALGPAGAPIRENEIP